MVINIGFITMAILIGSFIVYILFDIFNNNNKNHSKYFILLVFSIYLVNLFKYAIFPMYINSSIAEYFKNSMTTSEIIKSSLNLVPFLEGLNIKDFILNKIMTFPLGVLLPCIIKDLDTKK